MDDNGLLDVCIDDCRNIGDVIIRDPRVAIEVLRRLGKRVGHTYWDNDMGYGWEREGRHLLKQFIKDCKSAKWYPTIQIVTSNSVAAEDMRATLKAANYMLDADNRWVHVG